jgi:YggT family protein
MFVLGHFLDALAVIIYYALTIYMWVIIARAVLSWVSPDPYNPIVRFIYNLTEPVMHQIRTRIPVSFGGIDISPIIVLFAIIFLQKFVVGTLQGIARSLLLH